MNIKYNLGQTVFGGYQELKCDEESKAIIRDLCMLGHEEVLALVEKMLMVQYMAVIGELMI